MNRIVLPVLSLASTLAPLLCGLRSRMPTRRRRLPWSRSSGGKVTFDDNSPDKPVIGVNLENTHVTDDDLEYLNGLSRLRAPNLTQHRCD